MVSDHLSECKYMAGLDIAQVFWGIFLQKNSSRQIRPASAPGVD
jgi:hypothetical protein